MAIKDQQINKWVSRTDAFMNWFVKVGGVCIITIVLGIFIFILSQVLPLFWRAQVNQLHTIILPEQEYVALGIDEWGELPFLARKDGQLLFVHLSTDQHMETVPAGLPATVTPSVFSWVPTVETLVIGATDGSFGMVSIDWGAVFNEDGSRTITHSVSCSEFYRLGAPGVPIDGIALGRNDKRCLVAALQHVDGVPHVAAALLEQKQTMLGAGRLEAIRQWDLTTHLAAEPQLLAINDRAERLLISSAAGDVYYFALANGDLQLQQIFRPFREDTDEAVAQMGFLLGGTSLVLTNPSGRSVVYSLYRAKGATEMIFNEIQQLPSLQGAPTVYASSQRNKSFLLGGAGFLSLRHSTTAHQRWHQLTDYTPMLASIGQKHDLIVTLDELSQLHRYSLRDPHPEASWRALFGRIWYEGYEKPEYAWQSTGFSDSFEPKLSLVPLMFGTFKGTFYAMIFALPLSLLAALYASEFMHPRFRVFVKPTMEIMASLPSVVLGFLGALWLAPLLENRMPSVFCMLIILPVAACLCGWCWSALPARYRLSRIPGNEFLLMLPVLLAAAWLAWQLGIMLEQSLFVYTDGTGARVADFRRWWTIVTGTDFQQRNSVVVGFMMGFAVIPIIFTIAEDSLSNVPRTLRSGSLALGASRWQTALKVVLPTASPGIFSAIMIGLGRAVGETMIVVMATGNTPIMDWNIFSGMRTLSANIAVELPEAPFHSTLYRTLFLGALVLFLLTFLLNTLAELLRQHLRTRYRTVE